LARSASLSLPADTLGIPLERISIVAAGIANLTDATFDEVVKASSKPIVVDFWADWCGPCKMIAPILAEIATEEHEKLTVAKLNVDENPAIAMRYQVRSIPTLLVFKDGVLAKTMVGAKGKGQMLRELSEFLGTSH
jgi:thioredoxin 1